MKKVAISGCCIVLTVATAWALAQEDLPQGQAQVKQLDSKQYSYAIGLDIGKNFESMGVELDAKSLAAGVQAGLAGKKAKLMYDQETLAAAMQQLQQLMQQKERMRQQSLSMKHKQEGAEFLAKNKDQEGVQVTKSGLQYKVVESGDGATPGPGDTVSCHYRGTLIDGTEFDSSYSRGQPAEFPVNRVIAGWTEALQMMKVGDKWQLFIPSDLAYGDNGAGALIKPGSTLIFDIELLDIVK